MARPDAHGFPSAPLPAKVCVCERPVAPRVHPDDEPHSAQCVKCGRNLRTVADAGE